MFAEKLHSHPFLKNGIKVRIGSENNSCILRLCCVHTVGVIGKRSMLDVSMYHSVVSLFSFFFLQLISKIQSLQHAVQKMFFVLSAASTPVNPHGSRFTFFCFYVAAAAAAAAAVVTEDLCLTLGRSVCLMKNLISDDMLSANTDTHTV